MPRKPERILPFRPERRGSQKLDEVLNLGPKSVAWLDAAGITTLAQVKRLGPIEVCRRLHLAGRPVAVTMAYALHGALTGVHWNAIPQETKESLRLAFGRMKSDPDAPTAPIRPQT